MNDKQLNCHFPCDFPIKIMGHTDPHFEAKILSILRKHSPDLGEAAIKIKHSKKNKYTSITAIVPAKSKEQVDRIYQALTAEKSVLLVL